MRCAGIYMYTIMSFHKWTGVTPPVGGACPLKHGERKKQGKSFAQQTEERERERVSFFCVRSSGERPKKAQRTSTVL